MMLHFGRHGAPRAARAIRRRAEIYIRDRDTSREASSPRAAASVSMMISFSRAEHAPWAGLRCACSPIITRPDAQRRRFRTRRQFPGRARMPTGQFPRMMMLAPMHALARKADDSCWHNSRHVFFSPGMLRVRSIDRRDRYVFAIIIFRSQPSFLYFGGSLSRPRLVLH